MQNKLKPLVSVIIPVYNGEEWIGRCLDSLMMQTLNNIEVIAVNNGSTDGTWDILQKYANIYSEKLVIREIEHTNGPGSGRNVGLSLAQAEYIGFADADDYFEYNAMELLYNKTQEDDYDIVYCASYDVKGQEIKVTRKLAQTDKKFVERNGSMVYWNKLFKKNLFDKAGKIPEDIVFEDIAYVSVLISLAEKIGYVDKSLYYYILRDDSGVNDLKSDRILHALQANEIAISNCKDDTKNELIASILYRVYYDLSKARWTYADDFIMWLKKHREIFNIELVHKDAKLKKILDTIDSLSDDLIPEIVYYNAFEEVSEEYMNNAINAFRGEVAIIGLSSENCDVNKNSLVKRWYEAKQYDKLAAYFAMEKIYETGGFYISPKVEMSAWFNTFRYCDSVFGFEDDLNFTEEVFGGRKKSKAILGILNHISEIDNFTIKDAIKYVTVIERKISLNGKTQITDDKMVVLDPTILVTNLIGNFNICNVNYGKKEDDFITLKKSTIQSVLSR